MVVENRGREPDGRLQERDGMVRILVEPVQNAEMVVRGGVAGLKPDGALKVRLGLRATLEHGQQEADLILKPGRLGIGGRRLLGQGKRTGGIPLGLQGVRLPLQLRRRLGVGTDRQGSDRQESDRQESGGDEKDSAKHRADPIIMTAWWASCSGWRCLRTITPPEWSYTSSASFRRPYFFLNARRPPRSPARR